MKFGEIDEHLFAEGTHARLWERLGAHPTVDPSLGEGTRFAVWAPNAESVTVIGDHNDWGARGETPLGGDRGGVWSGFLPGVKVGGRYKYRIRSRHGGYQVDKADPFAFARELAPATASVVADLSYQWQDGEWLAARKAAQRLSAPMSIYEVHLGSWRRIPEDDNRSLSYREIAPLLAKHVRDHGFTHVELMPVMEHPFYGSWGYQVTGFFAPTSRYGSPQDFKYLVDFLHQEGIGVILDWPPAHFPMDEHGLIYFDGTHLYEHADPRQGHHPHWGSVIFNYGRHEVRSFLLSCARFWIEEYHIDGLRVDAVASMLYLDYGREAGQWIPNERGGRENLEAVRFLRVMNETLYREHPDIQVIAEESTAWPMVSRPTDLGGLGFGLKWDMGFMNDTLSYFAQDPIHRRYHHHKLTFRQIYAGSENFVLPLSHDEVVHGKGALIEKMPGDDWQKFANLRLLYSYMWAQPGKKILFMGGEMAQRREWNHDTSLDWHLMDAHWHAAIARLVGALNHLYRSEPALHELDCEGGGFEWVDANDADNSVYSFLRIGKNRGEAVLVVLNCTPVPRFNYRIGVPYDGHWDELLNSDAETYGGSGHGNFGGVEASPVPKHGRPFSLTLTLPPLGALFLRSP
ncbi:MAG TPA: 1,4-alpha-glucan branching protein GlgB, partial [Polyangia bacterium]